MRKTDPSTGDVVEVEAQIRGDPRDRGEHDDDRQDETCDVPAAPEGPPVADPAPREREDREGERDQRAHGGERVRRLCVEVALLHDARPGDGGAQDGGGDGRGGHPPRPQPVDDDGQDRDGHERGRKAGEDEHTARAGLEAGPADVVELVERQACVRDENRQREKAEARPHGDDFGETRARRVLGLQPPYTSSRHGRMCVL